MAGEVNFSGFNGFDFGEIIDLMIQAESVPPEALHKQDQDLKEKHSALVAYGTNYKLVISSPTTGASNGFTINNSLTNGVSLVVAFAVGQSPTVERYSQ